MEKNTAHLKRSTPEKSALATNGEQAVRTVRTHVRRAAFHMRSVFFPRKAGISLNSLNIVDFDTRPSHKKAPYNSCLILEQ